MNSEQITAFLQEYWYIASVLIGVVILIGAIRNWNWLCDPTGTRDAHRHSRGYRRVVFFLLGVLLIVVSTAMDAVGEMLDEAEKLAEKAKAAIKAALADEDSRYHSVVTFFMEFHRDDVGPDIVAELFPGTDPAKLSFAEMVDFLKLKRFGSLVDSEMNQQVFILDLSFNPEITDELMVIYFDLNKEIFCITHES